MLPHVAKIWYESNIGFNTHTYNTSDPDIIATFAKKIVESCISVIGEYGIHGSELVIADLREQFDIRD